MEFSYRRRMRELELPTQRLYDLRDQLRHINPESTQSTLARLSQSQSCSTLVQQKSNSQTQSSEQKSVIVDQQSFYQKQTPVSAKQSFYGLQPQKKERKQQIRKNWSGPIQVYKKQQSGQMIRSKSVQNFGEPQIALQLFCNHQPQLYEKQFKRMQSLSQPSRRHNCFAR